ncbi:hypothetical protein KAT24_01415 [Candidatus Pacearchaeota archaeon]|nr:hypothetical protein [Candidatus Pacearchaeota archaeon]
MKVVDRLEYKNFQTIVKLTKEVEGFLLKNNIDLKLSSRIPSAQYWYENNLFPLNRLKDKDIKNFELIYCGIIERPEEYESLENIMKKFKLTKEDVVFDGSVTLLELKDTFVRWILIKA